MVLSFASLALVSALIPSPAPQDVVLRTPVGPNPPASGTAGPSQRSIAIGPVCAESLIDESTGDCGIRASSDPTLGHLYPLSTDFFVDPSGQVGIGTTTPTAALDVVGTLRAENGIRFADGSVQTRAVDLALPREGVTDQFYNTELFVEIATSQWQSFTAGLTGELVRLGRMPTRNGLTVNIYAGEGPDGALLASEVKPAGFEVQFANPAFVEAGSVYTIYVEGNAPFGFSWTGDDLNSYPHGRGSIDPPWDFTFRTSVALPGTPVNPALSVESNGNVLIDTSQGFLGVGRTNPSHPVHVGNDTTNGNGAHVTTGGTWVNGSSREWKSNFRQLDSAEVLERLTELEILRWEYTGSEEGDHIGPMAEDFHAAFGLGDTERYISTVDADGVVMAAIQALAQENRELRERLDALEARGER